MLKQLIPSTSKISKPMQLQNSKFYIYFSITASNINYKKKYKFFMN